jgi:hypothetical protein
VNNATTQFIPKPLSELSVAVDATIDLGIVPVTVDSVSFDHGKDAEEALLIGGTTVIGNQLLRDGVATIFGSFGRAAQRI